MGQRSQIYIKWNVTDNNRKYEGFIARYYQWNYGERMLSRARGVIEHLEYYLKYPCVFGNIWDKEKLARIADTNFDMRDIAASSNICKEYEEYGQGCTFEDFVFYEQDNNDGQLFIDVTDEGIKYAFAMEWGNWEYKPIDPEQYMIDDECGGKDWRKPAKEREYLDYTEDNIKYITENATLMTSEEIDEFIADAKRIYRGGGAV